MPSLSNHGIGSAHRWLIPIAALAWAAIAFPLPLDAQTVRPAVVEHQGRGRGSFDLVNETLFPLTVVLEPRGFQVDTNGTLIDLPFDTAKVKLRLSAMSFRIPPLATYTVHYEADAEQLPAWFMVLSSMTGARTNTGINVRIELPHVVYLLQKEPLKKEAVSVRAFDFDSAAGRAVLDVENTSAALGRVIGSELSVGGRNAMQFGGFPLFPLQRRRIEVPWKGQDSPDKVLLRFSNFTVEERRRAPGT